MPLTEEKVIYPTMIELAACLCTELAAAGGPELCYCGPVTGEVSLDYCGGSCDGEGCGGQAWVRFVDAFPSSEFPSASVSLANCKVPLAFNIEVGVARCAPSGEANAVSGFVGPTLEQNVEALRIQMSDLAAMRRAIQCCFGNSDADYIMGIYQGINVNTGGCLGGTITLTVWETF